MRTAILMSSGQNKVTADAAGVGMREAPSSTESV
jgi:hypothetical protein